MRSSSPFATNSLDEALQRWKASRRADDLAYQAVTLAAMLMLLGGLLAF